MRAPGGNTVVAIGQRSGSLGELVMEFEQAARLTAEAKQVQAKVRVVKRFLWGAGVAAPAEITAAAITAYLARQAARGSSPKTVLNHRSALSTFCGFLRQRGLLKGNPCRGIRLARLERRLPRYLEPDEVEQVLRIAGELGIWPEVCLALSTGLRLSELIRLQWTDIDVARRMLTVQKSKSHRPRVVPLSTSALGALARQRARSGEFSFVFPARQTWRGGWRFVDKHRASNWWRRALRPIQDAVPKFRTVKGTGRAWHLFRHTFASRAAQAGVSLYKLAAWLGHADVRTTQIYAHLQAGFDEEIERAAPVSAAVQYAPAGEDQ